MLYVDTSRKLRKNPWFWEKSISTRGRKFRKYFYRGGVTPPPKNISGPYPLVDLKPNNILCLNILNGTDEVICISASRTSESVKFHALGQKWYKTPGFRSFRRYKVSFVFYLKGLGKIFDKNAKNIGFIWISSSSTIRSTPF